MIMEASKFDLIWGEESDAVMGAVASMTREEFFEQVMVDIRECEIEAPDDLCIDDIKRQHMIHTEQTIDGGAIRPLTRSGVVIEDYWTLEFPR